MFHEWIRNYRQISRFFKYGGLGLGNRMSPNSPDLGNVAEILQIWQLMQKFTLFLRLRSGEAQNDAVNVLFAIWSKTFFPSFFRDKFFLLLMVGNNKYTSYWGIRGGRKLGGEGEGEVEKEKIWSWKMYERVKKSWLFLFAKAKKICVDGLAKEWTDNRPGENHSDLVEILIRTCVLIIAHGICLIAIYASIQIGLTVVQNKKGQ